MVMLMISIGVTRTIASVAESVALRVYEFFLHGYVKAEALATKTERIRSNVEVERAA